MNRVICVALEISKDYDSLHEEKDNKPYLNIFKEATQIIFFNQLKNTVAMPKWSWQQFFGDSNSFNTSLVMLTILYGKFIMRTYHCMIWSLVLSTGLKA